MSWARVAWQEELQEEEGVIPSIWIDHTLLTVRWPRSNVNSLRKEMAIPTDKWLSFPLIKVKLRSNSYQECDNFNHTSTVELEQSDEEDRPRKRRRLLPTRNTEFVSDYSSASESVIIRYPKPQRQPITATPKATTPPSTPSTPDQLNLTTVTLADSPPLDHRRPESKPSSSSTPAASQDLLPTSLPTHQDSEVRNQYPRVFDYSVSERERNDRFFTTVLKELMDVKKAVNRIQRGHREEDEVVEFEQLTDVDSVVNFSSESKQKLIRRLSQIGGNTPRNTVSNVMNKVITTEAQSKLNMYGNGTGSKTAFINTDLYGIVKQVITDKCNVTETHAYSMIRDHLKHAPSRLSNQSNKKSK